MGQIWLKQLPRLVDESPKRDCGACAGALAPVPAGLVAARFIKSSSLPPEYPRNEYPRDEYPRPAAYRGDLNDDLGADLGRDLGKGLDRGLHDAATRGPYRT